MPALPRASSHRVPLYECVLIARNDVTQQQVEGIADGIATQLETEGGEMKKREYWGLRGLAYRIKKNRKGHYSLLAMALKKGRALAISRLLHVVARASMWGGAMETADLTFQACASV